MQVYRSKHNGGLGIGNIEHRNKALLFKWVWRFGLEITSYGRRIICSKYLMDPDSPWWSTTHSSNCSHFMKSIYTLLTVESIFKSLIDEGLGLSPGDGSLIKFWQDSWLFNESLCSLFPRIFALSVNKFGTISDYGSWSGSSWFWSFPLRRGLFGWEIEQWNKFRLHTDQVSLCQS